MGALNRWVLTALPSDPYQNLNEHNRRVLDERYKLERITYEMDRVAIENFNAAAKR